MSSNLFSEQIKSEISELKDIFENKYKSEIEPWEYSLRGAEKLRYKKIKAIAVSYVPTPNSVLDIGCSLGQFTMTLLGYAKEISAIDIAPTAIQKAKLACEEQLKRMNPSVKTILNFTTGSSLEIPSLDSVYDIVFYCDGIVTHELTPEMLSIVFTQIQKALKKDGVAIFTDYMHPKRFESHIEVFKKSGFEIAEVVYLNDRLWFQFKSLFKAISKNGLVKLILSSEKIASLLSIFSSLLGKNGSKHICIVVKLPK
jgi:2-polyprenyl-3-methyl-5-hydroxy-6-metoxy-1,4-benzoquinol methylase